MLKDKQIQQINARIRKENIKYTKLARKIKCSTTNLIKILNKENDFPKIEKRVLNWLYNKNECKIGD